MSTLSVPKQVRASLKVRGDGQFIWEQDLCTLTSHFVIWGLEAMVPLPGLGDQFQSEGWRSVSLHLSHDPLCIYFCKTFGFSLIPSLLPRHRLPQPGADHPCFCHVYHASLVLVPTQSSLVHLDLANSLSFYSFPGISILILPQFSVLALTFFSSANY